MNASSNNQLIRKDPMNTLPSAISREILPYLDPTSLNHCRRVNKNWKEFTENDFLWKRFLPKEIAFSENTNARSYIFSHGTVSTAILKKEIQIFASKIGFGQTGSFICKFPLNPTFNIEIAFGYSDTNLTIPLKPDLEKICFFLTQLPTDESPPLSSIVGDYTLVIGNRNYRSLHSLIANLPSSMNGTIDDIKQTLLDRFKKLHATAEASALTTSTLLCTIS